MTALQATRTVPTPWHLWVIGAIAVLGGILGALLWLLRRRLAVWVFLVSLVAMVVTTFHNDVLSDGLEIFADTGSHAFTAVIFVIALGLFIYAGAMHKRGVLV
jgi:hypothetical protein